MTNIYLEANNGKDCAIHKGFSQVYFSQFCNTYSDGEYSAYIRAWGETDCNGFVNPTGHLFKFDCDNFKPADFNANTMLSYISNRAQQNPQSRFFIKLARTKTKYQACYIGEKSAGDKDYRIIRTITFCQPRYEESFLNMAKHKLG
jgi:hypothetical protein